MLSAATSPFHLSGRMLSFGFSRYVRKTCVVKDRRKSQSARLDSSDSMELLTGRAMLS